MVAKYLEFREIGKSASGKTKIIHVLSNGSDVALGQIKWFAPWRKYTLHTYEDNVFDGACLLEIVNELDRLNREHKEESHESR